MPGATPINATNSLSINTFIPFSKSKNILSIKNFNEKTLSNLIEKTILFSNGITSNCLAGKRIVKLVFNTLNDGIKFNFKNKISLTL